MSDGFCFEDRYIFCFFFIENGKRAVSIYTLDNSINLEGIISGDQF